MSLSSKNLEVSENQLFSCDRLLHDVRDEGFKSLKFPELIERLYLNNNNQRIIRLLNLIFFWSVALYFSFYFVDYQLSPNNYQLIWFVRTAFFLPLITLAFYLGKRVPFFQGNGEYIIAILTVIAVLSDIPLLYYGESKYTYFYVYVSYLSIIIFAQGFMEVRLRTSIITFLVGIGATMPFITHGLVNFDIDSIIHMMMLGVIASTGFISLYQKEYISRSLFIDACLLRIESKKLKDAQSDLKLLAETDGLTGLFNRRTMEKKFDEIIEWSLRTKTPFSTIMVDIDFFKFYNDHYGHQDGDMSLKLVSQTMKDTLNRATDVAARYGGEEFMMILPDTDQAGAMHVAETLRRNVESLHREHVKSPFNYITLSIGVYTEYLTENVDLTPKLKQTIMQQCMKKADLGLYSSKQNGRNRSTYYFDSYDLTPLE